MTYTQSDYEKVSQWVLGGCKDDFPLHGTTPDSDFEFTIMFDTDEVEYIDSRKALKERNTAQKEELAQARAAAKIDKDRAAIMAHLSDEK